MDSTRTHLLSTAIGLFAQYGFRGTGIDRIAGEAGVSKKTMYQLFRSKEELILAALRQYDSEFRNSFARSVEAIAGIPEERLLAVFDAAQRWFESEDFHGCVMIKAAGEFGDTDNPIRAFCSEAKRLMRHYFAELALAARISEAEELAAEVSLLFEGAIVMAHIDGDARHAGVARRAAAKLINSAVED